jgi:hypothetical protein
MPKQEKALLTEIIKYASTALLGAVVAFATTSFNRLPSRALTVLPAGIHVLQGPILACSDQTFITGEVNEYLDTNILPPPCDVLLSRNQVNALKSELDRAKTVYLNERISPFRTALDRLQEVEHHPPQDEAHFHSRVLQAVANLVYISKHAPAGVPAHDLLLLLEKDVSTALTSVNTEVDHIRRILDVMEGKQLDTLRDHLELYFVVDNSSDIEFYLPTHCSLSADDKKIQMVLENTKNDEIPVSSLVYLPILPGRGKLLKYSLDNAGAAPLDSPDFESVKRASLNCTLPSNKVITSPVFQPAKFTVREKTF